MAITIKEELIGTWVFNTDIYYDNINYNMELLFNIQFTSNNYSYNSILLSQASEQYLYYNETLASKSGKVCMFNTTVDGCVINTHWENQAYRTIEITDVSQLTNEQEFISFMNSNAVKQTPKLISLENLKAFKQKCDEVYKYTLSQATETVLGGIKAKPKTTEDNEVVIDTASGKLYVASDKVSVSGFEAGNNIIIGKNETGDKLKISLSDNVLTTDDLGKPSGVVPLGGTLDEPKIDSKYLPSYVDDVLEFGKKDLFPNPGADGKIYVALDTNKTYRWGGSAYVEISSSLALGETSSTAYAGDKGKANADAIVTLQTSKQDTLKDGENIKTINGKSILGGGNMTITIPSIDYATTQDIASLFNK